MAILSGMSSDEFIRCVQATDTTALIRLPGIGKKTAERLVMEMRDRLDKLEVVTGSTISMVHTPGAPADTPVSDAVGALIALGYKPNEASRMVRMIDTEGLVSEEIIRLALK